MQIVKKGNPPWVGRYRCGFCESVFNIELEDGDKVHRIETDYGDHTKVRRIKLGRCPVCSQRRNLTDPEFERVGDLAAPAGEGDG